MKPAVSKAYRRWLYLAAGSLFCLLLALERPAFATDPTPTPHAMAPMTDRLAPPPMPANPTQADLGAMVYYKVCMACHGDRGQGLTPEFRALLGPQDENCWQSKCHASNHMPGGFVFPKVVPAIITPAMAARFPTAASLHDFIRTNMPYNKPGGLTDEEYWQLTAFLVRANGGGPLPAALDASDAPAVSLQPGAGRMPPWLILIVVVVLAWAAFAAWWVDRRRAAVHE